MQFQRFDWYETPLLGEPKIVTLPDALRSLTPRALRLEYRERIVSLDRRVFCVVIKPIWSSLVSTGKIWI